RALDQYRVNAVSPVFRNHSATSFVWKGRSSISRSRLSNSVISSAVLGFLIWFNAREMCSSRRRLEFGIFRISGFPFLKNELSLFLTGSRCQHGSDEDANQNGRSWLPRRQQLNDQVSYCPRLVLARAANQGVRALEARRSFHFHFPVVVAVRPDN